MSLYSQPIHCTGVEMATKPIEKRTRDFYTFLQFSPKASLLGEFSVSFSVSIRWWTPNVVIFCLDL